MKFLISTAYAAAEKAATMTEAAGPVPAAPGMAETFMMNMVLISILVGLFYLLLIRPQQKRFKKHRQMMDSLKKGDSVLTAGGFIGKIDKVIEGKDEVVVDLGGGLKVTALRSTIQNRVEDDKAE